MDERESNKHNYDQFMHTSGRFFQSAKGTSGLFTIYSIKYGIQPLSLLRANGKGESVSRKTGRDRKDTFHGRPVHPDAVPSLNRMIGEVDQALLLQAVVIIEETVHLEANAQLLYLEIDEGDDVDCDCNTSNDI